MIPLRSIMALPAQLFRLMPIPNGFSVSSLVCCAIYASICGFTCCLRASPMNGVRRTMSAAFRLNCLVSSGSNSSTRALYMALPVARHNSKAAWHSEAVSCWKRLKGVGDSSSLPALRLCSSFHINSAIRKASLASEGLRAGKTRAEAASAAAVP